MQIKNFLCNTSFIFVYPIGIPAKDQIGTKLLEKFHFIYFSRNFNKMLTGIMSQKSTSEIGLKYRTN